MKRALAIASASILLLSTACGGKGVIEEFTSPVNGENVSCVEERGVRFIETDGVKEMAANTIVSLTILSVNPEVGSSDLYDEFMEWLYRCAEIEPPSD